MIHIDEWHIPQWIALEWEAIPPPWKQPPQRPPGGAPASGGLVDAIRAALEPFEARAVHFFEGEGLRWIRVGFDRGHLRQPQDVARVGRAIAACVPPPLVLRFHALRPYDLLFFLEGGEPDRVGYGADYYGVPLDDVLASWGVQAPALPVPAGARAVKAQPQRRIRNAAGRSRPRAPAR